MSRTINVHHSLEYYNGLDPKMRALNKKGKRPTEFGNKVWPTSLVVIDYLRDTPFELEGLRVLEIGCGWGLIGIYLAKEFNCIVTCSDFDPLVLPIVEVQAELNEVKITTLVSSFSGFTEKYLSNFDLIIGAEVCYSAEVAVDLSVLVERAERAKVGQILIADPGRPDFSELVALCETLCTVRVETLAGTSNGKTTNLLIAQTDQA